MKHVLFALLLCASCKSREMKRIGDSKEDVANLSVHKLAFEAFPQWVRAHVDKACPDNLEQLTEYASDVDTKDPWGHSYKLLCGSNAPSEVHGLGVVSFGADGKEGTTDDIKSWE